MKFPLVALGALLFPQACKGGKPGCDGTNPRCAKRCVDKYPPGKDRGQCVAECCRENRRLGHPVEKSSWEDFKSKCSEENYILIGFIDRHVHLIAKPKKPPEDPHPCPAILFHEDEWGKEIVDLSDENHVEKYGADESIYLGNFKFDFLAYAWDHAEGSPQSLQAEYDIVHNNCATVVLNMMKNLGIDIHGPEVVDYAVAKLHQNGLTIEELRNSPSVMDILPEGSQHLEYDDAKLLEILANYATAKHDK